MHFAHSHYAKVGKLAGDKLKQRIEQQRRERLNAQTTQSKTDVTNTTNEQPPQI